MFEGEYEKRLGFLIAGLRRAIVALVGLPQSSDQVLHIEFLNGIEAQDQIYFGSKVAVALPWQRSHAEKEGNRRQHFEVGQIRCDAYLR